MEAAPQNWIPRGPASGREAASLSLGDNWYGSWCVAVCVEIQILSGQTDSRAEIKMGSVLIHIYLRRCHTERHDYGQRITRK